MNWIKSNCLWAALNLSAVSVLVYTITQGDTQGYNPQTFDVSLESAKWAVRFLLLCLSMTPLRTIFRWNASLKLRKSAGLWSFGFACVHVLITTRQTQPNWLRFPLQPFIVLGLVSLVIMSTLALTSNRFAMRRLKKNWKRLHRMVYLAGGTILYHAIVATSSSKKLVGDPEAVQELKIYLAILTFLLAVRIPFVRRLFNKIKRERPMPKRRATPVVRVEEPHIPIPTFTIPSKQNGHPPIPKPQDLPDTSETEEEEQLERVPF